RPQRRGQLGKNFVEKNARLLANSDVLGRAGSCASIHAVGRRLTPSGVRAAPVGGDVAGDLTEKAPLRTRLDIVDPPGRSDEGALYLVVEVRPRNTQFDERSPDQPGIVVDERGHALFTCAQLSFSGRRCGQGVFRSTVRARRPAFAAGSVGRSG